MLAPGATTTMRRQLRRPGRMLAEAPDGEHRPGFAYLTTRQGWHRWVPGLSDACAPTRAAGSATTSSPALVLTALLVPAGMGYAEAAGPAGHLRALRVDRPTARVRRRSGRRASSCSDPTRPCRRSSSPAVVAAGRRRSRRRAAAAACAASSPASLCVAAGLARFGFLTDLLSLPGPLRLPERHRPRRSSSSQLPKLFGFSTDAHRRHRRAPRASSTASPTA